MPKIKKIELINYKRYEDQLVIVDNLFLEKFGFSNDPFLYLKNPPVKDAKKEDDGYYLSMGVLPTIRMASSINIKNKNYKMFNVSWLDLKDRSLQLNGIVKISYRIARGFLDFRD